MCVTIRKSQSISFKYFTAWLTEINNYLPLFPKLIYNKKMTPEELIEILLHVAPNGLVKQFYLQGWDVEGKTHKKTCEIFERIEIP